MIYQGLESLVGNTPVLQLKRLCRQLALPGDLYVKMECLNPTGSSCDRVALAFLDSAMRAGRLRPGATLVAPTLDGALGASLATFANLRGMKCLVPLPLDPESEAWNRLVALGATPVRSDPAAGWKGVLELAQNLQDGDPDVVVLDPFSEPSIETAHVGTGEEIFREFKGVLDCVVLGVQTGATLAGVGGYLKKKMPKLRVVAQEDEAAPCLVKGRPSRYPAWVKKKSFDVAVGVNREEAAKLALPVLRAEGIRLPAPSLPVLAAAIAQLSERGGSVLALV